MDIMEFSKGGFNFSFRNPNLHGKTLSFQWKIIGISENKDNEGYFYNANYIPEKNVIGFSEVKAKGKKFNGVTLLEPQLSQVANLYKNMVDARQSYVDGIIDKVVTGETPITFSMVGCDYPHYQPWIENLDNDLSAHYIMEKATLKISGMKYISGNICDWLDDCRSSFHKDFSDAQNGKTFTITLEELITPRINAKREKEATEKARLDDIFTKAKEMGEKQLLRKWSEDCNDRNEECNVDIVYEYAMPDGTTKKERHHTW